MQRLGFIHDMMDVKVLILFVMARVNYPVKQWRSDIWVTDSLVGIHARMVMA